MIGCGILRKRPQPGFKPPKADIRVLRPGWWLPNARLRSLWPSLTERSTVPVNFGGKSTISRPKLMRPRRGSRKLRIRLKLIMTKVLRKRPIPWSLNWLRNTTNTFSKGGLRPLIKLRLMMTPCCIAWGRDINLSSWAHSRSMSGKLPRTSRILKLTKTPRIPRLPKAQRIRSKFKPTMFKKWRMALTKKTT